MHDYFSTGHHNNMPVSRYNSFIHEKHGKWSLLIHKGIDLDEALKLIPPGDNSAPDDHLFRKMRSSSNARVFLASCLCNGRAVDVYIKHYLFRSAFDFLKHFFRPGRGKRAFNASLMLKRAGLQAPEPLILMQKTLGPFKTDNILVTEAKNSHKQLSSSLKELADLGSTSSVREKRSLLTDFGTIIGRMHEQGIIHGDLRTGNVLVKKEAHGFLFCFIDNERTRKYPKAPLQLVKKNLVQINMFRTGISNADRLRFMKAYAGQRRLSQEESLALIKMVVDRTRKRLEKKGLM